MNKNNNVPCDSHGNGNRGKGSTRDYRRGKHEVNLQKRGFLNFQIGLILALLLVYAGLEASFRMQKEYGPQKAPAIDQQLIYEQDIPYVSTEPATEKIRPEKSFKIDPEPEEALSEVGADVIDLPVDGSDEGTMALDSIPYHDLNKEEPATIIIDLVEEVPIFPGCEKVKKEMRLDCFKEKITRHVKRNFRYPDAAKDLNIQGKVNVLFKIDVDGNVRDIQMRGPSTVLEEEAERIIGKLPKMVPGKQGGKAVRVPYSLPIVFQLN